MEVTYICAATGLEVVGSTKLPEGWMIPPLSVARDIDLEVPKHGTVIALSSEAAWKALYKKRLEENLSEA